MNFQIQEWKHGTIIKLSPKGDLSDCNNWHRITLLSIPDKFFYSFMLKRLKNLVDARLLVEQAGFRPHRFCTDHILTLRTIIEVSVEFQSPLIIKFVDFQKAFGIIHQLTLWKILDGHSFQKEFINAIKAFYSKMLCMKISWQNRLVLS